MVTFTSGSFFRFKRPKSMPGSKSSSLEHPKHKSQNISCCLSPQASPRHCRRKLVKEPGTAVSGQGQGASTIGLTECPVLLLPERCNHFPDALYSKIEPPMASNTTSTETPAKPQEAAASEMKKARDWGVPPRAVWPARWTWTASSVTSKACMCVDVQSAHGRRLVNSVSSAADRDLCLIS